jgi:ABC-2 type transport system ATP-binding protein
MISISNLYKNYGGNMVLQNVNLEFKSGLVYGVVGPNGAGKTTLFRCIAGLTHIRGEIAYQVTDMKKSLGFLPTEPYFMTYLTGREYLQLLCNARKLPTPDFDEANIFDLPLDRYASTYSTGMKKKLALMGILLQKNQIFILDEPFNGVDIQSNLLITEIIQTLKSLHRTLIISSHILSTLTDTCDLFVVMKDGIVNSPVDRKAFADIENEMRLVEIGNKIEKLHL